MSEVTAVVVLYNPDVAFVVRLLQSLSGQVETTILADNSEESCKQSIDHLLTAAVQYLWMGGNLGLGAAHNRGITRAFADGADYVLLLDQDSLPSEQMVLSLLCGAQKYLQNHPQEKLGAIGPSYNDANGQEQSPFVILDGWRIRRAEDSAGEFVKVVHLISSGTLIPHSAIEVVGPMNEELFIDYVDSEWCWRASHCGLTLLGYKNATMEHCLGDESIRLLGKSITLRSPLRCYYTMRNGVWLLRQPFVPLRWSVADALRLLGMFVLFSVFSRQRVKSVKMMIRGLVDGLRSKMGPLS